MERVRESGGRKGTEMGEGRRDEKREKKREKKKYEKKGEKKREGGRRKEGRKEGRKREGKEEGEREKKKGKASERELKVVRKFLKIHTYRNLIKINERSSVVGDHNHFWSDCWTVHLQVHSVMCIVR